MASDGARAPRIVCFDAQGTLIETTETVGEVYAEIARDYGVALPAWRLDDAFHRVLRSSPARCAHHEEASSVEARRQLEFAWWAERIRQTFQAADSTVRFADLAGFSRALFEAYQDVRRWRLRPQVEEALDSLRARAVRMVVVSNFDYRLRELLGGIEIEHYFEAVFLPCETGLSKPDPRLFDLVSRRLDTSPSDLVYVGDESVEALRPIAQHGVGIIRVADLEDFSELDIDRIRAATLFAGPTGAGIPPRAHPERKTSDP